MKQRRPGKPGRAEAAPAEASTSRPAAAAEKKSFPIVGIGASAGGLEAFTELLQGLPVDTGMGFALVQHLDPDRASELTHILARTTAMRVQEVASDTRVEPNQVYVIPPNAGMSIRQGVLHLYPRPVSGTFRSIDSFFQSLAEDQRECAIGIVLSGTASDGTVGIGAIKEQNGITFAQDDTAKYDSMPRSAIASGYVDFVLSPGQMAEELARIATHPYVRGAGAGAGRRSPKEAKGPEVRSGAGRGASEPRGAARGEEAGFTEILALLRNHAAVDFSCYKRNTIERRMTRRVVLNKLESLRDYAQLLAGDGRELDSLYGDLLINVTSFFRNPEALEGLKRLVFSKLGARRTETVRVWVPGCSSGQEAYSVAMALSECNEQGSAGPKLQMFATDLSETLLEKARAGLYPKALVQDLSPERLRRFFVEEEGGFRVVKALRDGIVFARHNLLNDPPFSRLDLISCRNLLIYLEPAWQQKIIPMFHYALNRDGHLLLGASESVSSFTELFESRDRKHKIYVRKAGSSSGLHVGMGPWHGGAGKGAAPGPARPETAGQLWTPNAQREADRIALNRYAPPGVLLSGEWQVMQFRGETTPYLKQPSGKPNLSVLNMARKELKQPLQEALQKAKRERRVQRRENLRLEQNGHSRTVSLEVVPLVNLKERCFLVFFEEPLERPRPLRPEMVPGRQTGGPKAAAGSRRVAELERELGEARDYAQSVQEQHEAVNEELQASNEEVTSANEELQSINEELETSTEELESSNEELVTLNEEMAHRNAELGRLNSDLLNFQGAANMAIVLLALDQTIRRFTAKATGAFNLTATDVGRSINSIRFNLELPDLEPMVAEVMSTLQERELEVRDRSGRWFSLRVLPYRSVDNAIDGAVLVLVDIDALKRNAQELIEARDYTEAIVSSTRDMLVVLNADLRVNSANEVFYETFHISPREAEGRLIYELGNGQWNIPRLRQLLEEILPRNSFFAAFEVSHDFQSIGRRVMVLNARTLVGPEGRTQRILLGIHDLTERVEAQAEVRRSELRYRRLFESAQDGVLLVDPASQRILDANPFMRELLGRTREELGGRTPRELGLFESPEACQKLFGQLRREDFRHQEDLALLNKSGERREVEFISTLYEEDGASVIQCNVRDISARKRAEAALRESEQRALLAVDTAELGTYQRDLRTNQVNMNAVCREILGCGEENPPADVASRSLYPEDAERILSEVARAFDPARREVCAGEFRIVRPDGSLRWVSGRGRVLFDESTQPATPQKFVGVLSDITERKEMEEALRRSQARLAQAVQVAQLATFEHDHVRDTVEISPLLRDILGFGPEEPVTLPGILERVPPDDRERAAAEIHKAHDPNGDGMFQIDHPIVAGGQGVRWISVRSQTFFEGEGAERHPARTIGAVLDITERKAFEAELQRLVDERTAKLQELVGELEHFSYTITHDMRAPLRGMQGYAEMMAQAFAGGQMQDTQRFLERIRTSAARMDVLITDALSYSKAVRQELALSPVDLGLLLRGMLDSYPELQPSNARIEIKGEIPAVMGNEAALTQCFSNLLGNAVKFVKPGEKPEIVIWAEKREGATTGAHRGTRTGASHLTPAPFPQGRGESGWVRIWVKDKGIGVAESMLARVFEMFSRGQSGYPGTGIGLALVRKVVERMGGSVGVESEEGLGSRFWVELEGVKRASGAATTRRAEEAG